MSLPNHDLLTVHVAPASSNQCNNSLNGDQKNNLTLASGITGICSGVSCAIALTVLFAMRLYRLFVYRLAMYQVLGQSFTVTAVLMQVDFNSRILFYRVVCKMSAFLMQFSMWVKMMFTIQLTFHLFFYVVFFKNLKRLEVVYIALSVSLPLVLACVPFITHSYNLAGAWCYISSGDQDCSVSDSDAGVIEQFALYYGPATLLLSVNVVGILTILSVVVYRTCKHASLDRDRAREPLLAINTNRDQKREVLRQLLPLLVYPVIYFSLLLFPLSNRIYMAVSKSTDYYLIMVHAVTISSTGFFAGLALIAHMCFVCFKKRQLRQHVPTGGGAGGRGGGRARAVGAGIMKDSVPSASDYLATAGTAPGTYTSGAVTRYSLPNESEVDAVNFIRQHNVLRASPH